MPVKRSRVVTALEVLATFAAVAIAGYVIAGAVASAYAHHLMGVRR